MKKLENKVSIVTGAGAGMGKAIAMRFLKEGSKVVATDIQEKRMEDLKNEAKEFGDNLVCIVADMGKEEDINKMIKTAVDKFGTLDILVNNAGIMDNFEPVGECPNAKFQKVMKVNVEGPFIAMREAIKIFLPKKSGAILNIASVGGLRGARAGAAYTASKHALVGLTKNTGFVYAKTGIRCNAIAPGGVETSIGDCMDLNNLPALAKETIMPAAQSNPRYGKPEEIANAALFLVSDEASFVNGAILAVDGGWIAH